MAERSREEAREEPLEKSRQELSEDRPDGLPRGAVVIVGTPIGNLGDLSPRAAAALRAADLICCEDTRRTRVLLSAAGIPAPALLAVDRHREAAGAALAVGRARRGERVAVVTDAGMPGVSDPGERVVRAAAAAGVPVTAVPGPTAAVTAVVLSGLAGDRWCFEGFLPRKGRDRAARLAAVAGDARATVLYEAPSRVARTVGDLTAVCGAERDVVLARELTKLHEEIWRGSLGDAGVWLERCAPRGEWVLVVAGAVTAEVTDDDILEALARSLLIQPDRRAAVGAVASDLGVARRRVYELELASRTGRGDVSAGRGDIAGR